MISLCQQLAFCHSVNSAAATPVHLELTSMAGIVGTTLRAQVTGVNNWPVTLTEESYADKFTDTKQDLVGALVPFRTKAYFSENSMTTLVKVI